MYDKTIIERSCKRRLQQNFVKNRLKNSLGEGGDTPKNKKENPDIEDSAYLEGTKETTGLAFVWFLVFLAILIALGLYIWVASQRV